MKGSIHGDKCIPLVYEDTPDIMEEGDIFALETFATTGRGYANPSVGTSHYALNPQPEYPPLYGIYMSLLLLDLLKKRNYLSIFFVLLILYHFVEDGLIEKMVVLLKSIRIMEDKLNAFKHLINL